MRLPDLSPYSAEDRGFSRRCRRPRSTGHPALNKAKKGQKPAMANRLSALLLVLFRRVESILFGDIGIFAPSLVTALPNYQTLRNYLYQKHGIVCAPLAQPLWAMPEAVPARRSFRSNTLCLPVCLSTHATLRRPV